MEAPGGGPGFTVHNDTPLVIFLCSVKCDSIAVWAEDRGEEGFGRRQRQLHEMRSIRIRSLLAFDDEPHPTGLRSHIGVMSPIITQHRPRHFVVRSSSDTIRDNEPTWATLCSIRKVLPVPAKGGAAADIVEFGAWTVVEYKCNFVVLPYGDVREVIGVRTESQ